MHDLISRNPSRFELIMRLMDIGVLVLAGQISAQWHFHTALDQADPVHAIILYVCCALAGYVFQRLDVYVSWRGRNLPALMWRVAFAWAVTLLLGMAFSFLIHQIGALSRLWMVYWFVSGLLALLLSRLLCYSTLNYLRRKGLNCKRVIIIGYGAIGREMHRRARCQSWSGYEVAAVQAEAAELDALGNAAIAHITEQAAVADYAAAHHIDEIWITLPMSASAQLRELQFLLRNALLDIRWIPDTTSMHILSSRMVDFLGFPAVELNRPAASDANGVLKAVFDKVFALVALGALAPLFAVLAIAVKLSSPGPVFFKQARLGLNGVRFDVYKFRSMRVHQETGALTQARRDDARIGPLGRFMRRTSLDELPQFINVLRGDMSVVGPRPHALEHNAQYKDMLELYMLRHRVKPGITGWAQIHGYRGETDTVDKMAKRVMFDLYYIQHWSIWMDMRIVLWTALKGWSGKNAY